MVGSVDGSVAGGLDSVAIEKMEDAFVEQRGVGDECEAVSIFIRDRPPTDFGAGLCCAEVWVGYGGRQWPVVKDPVGAICGDGVIAGGKDPLHAEAGHGPLTVRWLRCIRFDLLGDEHLSVGVYGIAEMEKGGGGRQGIFGSDDDQFGAGGIGKKLQVRIAGSGEPTGVGGITC